MIPAIIIVSYLLGFLSLALLLRHGLQHASHCQIHRQRFLETIEKRFPTLFDGEVQREEIKGSQHLCPNCGQDLHDQIVDGTKCT